MRLDTVGTNIGSSPDGGSVFRSVIVSDPSIQIPHVKKVVRYSGPTVKSQAPKTPRTDTILPYIQHCMDLQLAVDPYKKRALFESID